jgi:3-isopropylmalate/(R)-2-methylmalate dehydratase small subunit
VDALFAAADPGPLTLTVDLEAQEVRTEAATYGFEIDPHRRHCLLEGLDDIGLSLQYGEQIREYERRRRSEAPWLFDALR